MSKELRAANHGEGAPVEEEVPAANESANGNDEEPGTDRSADVGVAEDNRTPLKVQSAEKVSDSEEPNGASDSENPGVVIVVGDIELQTEPAAPGSADVDDEGGTSAAMVSTSSVSENEVSVGRMLLLASSSSMARSSGINTELRDGMKQMVERGTPLAANVVNELKFHAGLIAEELIDKQLEELQSHCHLAAARVRSRNLHPK